MYIARDSLEYEVYAINRYAERGEFITDFGCKKSGINYPVVVQGCPFDVDTCFTVNQEGTGGVRPLSQNGSHLANHALTPSLSGKTSFILSLAGELGLDIYSVNLSSKGCVVIGFALPLQG